MKDERCTCPYCKSDITDFVHEQIVRYNRRRQAHAARQEITPERREEMTKASQERLRTWRMTHPEEAKASARAASMSRTAESFARQSKTVRETAQKKAVKFAELLFQAKESGIEITAEVEQSLIKKASEIVKAENRTERIARKKAEKSTAKKTATMSSDSLFQ